MTNAARYLTDAHAALARFRNGERTPGLGAELARLTDAHEAATIHFSADTYQDLGGAMAEVAAVLLAQVEDLLNVLLDDAGHPVADVFTSAALEADEGEPAWGWPICAQVEDTESLFDGYADRFSADPEAIADHLFAQLQEG